MDIPLDATLSQWLLWLAFSVIVILGAVVSYLIRRDIDRVDRDLKELRDDHVSREELQSVMDMITSIQRDTRNEFAELRGSMMASFSTGLNLIRADVRERHEENKGELLYLRGKVDELVRRRS